MRNSLPPLTLKGFLRLVYFAIQIVLLIGISGGSTTMSAATTRPPRLLSQSTSTRAIAFESVTMRAEPFSVTASVPFSTDARTRIAIFAMNLDLLGAYGLSSSSESNSAFTADAQDSAGKVYPLRIEHMAQVPGFPGITMIIVRLADDMGDVGDVLMGLNLHGTSSNRVRVAIGHMGGGPPDDFGAVATPAPATPPPADVPLVPETFAGAATDADTVRFLEQASWGPTAAEVTRVKAMGFRAYLNEQFGLPPLNVVKGSNYLDMPFLTDDQNAVGGCPTGSPQDCVRDNYTIYPLHKAFYTNALYGPDQLRQRVAWALHQILVVSGRDITIPFRLTPYLQALDRGAFGNYRTLLEEITLNPAMGEYLDMRLSRRTDPNENFAREILQLFSIGTVELNLDGTPKLDSQGSPIPSYSQTTVNEFTRVFTGWNFAAPIAAGITNYRDPLLPRGGTNHDFLPKTLLNGFVPPFCSGQGGQLNIECARSDMTVALNNIFNHPNVGPFVGKQMIQHLVTSNPSPPYVARVARVFNNDCDALYPQGCTGVRGNMRAVVQAILLDPEARGDVKTDPNFGKLREPAQYIINISRANNVKSFDRTMNSDGILGNQSTVDFTNTLDQGIFLPPTVFSYFQPGYEIPGLGKLGPAFGILSTSTTLRRANNVNTLVYTGVGVTTPPNTNRPLGTSLDLTNLETIANANPGGVVDQLNALMLHGTMSLQMRTSIVNAMGLIIDADMTVRARKRARTAVYLVATSSQFDIQR